MKTGPFHRLLVGLSRTDADAGLIHYAALVARRCSVEQVRFLHVLPAHAEAAATHDKAKAEVEAELKAYFDEVPATVKVACEVLQGPLMDRLLTSVREMGTDLILLGHRRDHPGRRALARRLAMKAPCSVWMVPQDAPAAITRILVPVDFSGHAADTLQVAISIARKSGFADCLALHVYFNEAHVSYEEYDQVLRGREEEAFREFLAPIDVQGVLVTSIFDEGANVAHCIARTAKDQSVNLIVMATRGRSRSAAILLGSVTEDVIIDTTIPLLVVKHFGARMGLLEALLDKTFRHKQGPQFD